MEDFFFFVAAFIAAALLLVVFYLLARLGSLERALSELQYSKSSQSVKYGKMTEQFIPFTKEFPFPAQDFRFLGNPIDGVAFTDEKIIFAEFKAAGSLLSPRQKRIKELVEQKKIEWYEQRIK